MEIKYNNNHELVGQSEAILNVSKAIKLLDGRDFRVSLVSGELGTQKNIAANILHHQSARRTKPFVAVDCKIVSGPWIESALDPAHPQSCLFSEKGVLCLQNVEALSLKAQGNLLRWLELSSQGNDPVSIIAITRSDLKKSARESTFLLELYEYLSRFHIHMPPLRERIVDMPLMLKKLLKEMGEIYQTRMTEVEPEVFEACKSYSWPGNIRQLEAMLQQVLLSRPSDTLLRTEHLPEYLRKTQAKVVVTEAEMKLPRQGVVLEDLEKNLIRQALEQVMGNQSRAARLLGISRFALRYRMEKYGLFPKTKEEIMAAAASEWSE